ncbi:hypothetical protein BDZ45DRAFT_687204 [Acephala macrosclerotiorum]|nr:hypothetical protein BDZ45DRAFT_687204 [Acephala macrosclerotiorum]
MKFPSIHFLAASDFSYRSKKQDSKQMQERETISRQRVSDENFSPKPDQTRATLSAISSLRASKSWEGGVPNQRLCCTWIEGTYERSRHGKVRRGTFRDRTALVDFTFSPLKSRRDDNECTLVNKLNLFQKAPVPTKKKHGNKSRKKARTIQ